MSSSIAHTFSIVMQYMIDHHYVTWLHDAVMYICKVFMYLIILTVHVKVDASDIAMINHVLHDYGERVNNAA